MVAGSPPPPPPPWWSSASCRPTGGVSALRPERGAARSGASRRGGRATRRSSETSCLCGSAESCRFRLHLGKTDLANTRVSASFSSLFFSISPPRRLQTGAGAFSPSSSPQTEVPPSLSCPRSAFKGASLGALAHARVRASSQLGLTSSVFGRPRSANLVRGVDGASAETRRALQLVNFSFPRAQRVDVEDTQSNPRMFRCHTAARGVIVDVTLESSAPRIDSCFHGGPQKSRLKKGYF